MGRDAGLNGFKILLTTATVRIVSQLFKLLRHLFRLFRDISVLVNKYQENHKRNKRNKENLRHYLTGTLGNALVYPYKPQGAYIHK